MWKSVGGVSKELKAEILLTTHFTNLHELAGDALRCEAL
jgi:hypothetical protein